MYIFFSKCKIDLVGVCKSNGRRVAPLQEAPVSHLEELDSQTAAKVAVSTVSARLPNALIWTLKKKNICLTCCCS